MATRNPATIKDSKEKAAKYIKINKKPAEEQIDEVESGGLHPVPFMHKNKRAQIKSVYVEVGANLGTKSLKFGIHADINDEEAAVVKNRLYFECLGSLERHIKEMGSESGPFRAR